MYQYHVILIIITSIITSVITVIKFKVIKKCFTHPQVITSVTMERVSTSRHDDDGDNVDGYYADVYLYLIVNVCFQ